MTDVVSAFAADVTETGRSRFRHPSNFTPIYMALNTGVFLNSVVHHPLLVDRAGEWFYFVNVNDDEARVQRLVTTHFAQLAQRHWPKLVCINNVYSDRIFRLVQPTLERFLLTPE